MNNDILKNMTTLLNIATKYADTLTVEELESINYAISSFKTVDDMQYNHHITSSPAPMIIGINYQQNGERIIQYICADAQDDRSYMETYAKDLSDTYDEVYITEVNLTDQDFINEIVTKGCRCS